MQIISHSVLEIYKQIHPEELVSVLSQKSVGPFNYTTNKRQYT